MTDIVKRLRNYECMYELPLQVVDNMDSAASEIERLRSALARYVCDCSDLCQLYDGWCEEGKELLPRMVCGQWARDALGDAARAELESKPFEERWDNA